MFTCLDHDDGSDYYLDTRNVCVFAGMKNYIGQNKVCDSSLVVAHPLSRRPFSTPRCPFSTVRVVVLCAVVNTMP